MLFNSIEFLIFFPIVFVLFWICPKKYRWIILLISSYFFYMYWNWKLVVLILFTTFVSYICGLLLEKNNSNKKIKKLIVAITMVLCLGVLIFFKYFNFLFEIFCNMINVFGGNAPKGFFTIMLPVGISFYTFQTLSYVIDIYRGTIRAERHFGYYALFVSFFPQLVAGPIERPQDLLPQLKNQDKSIKKLDYSGAFRYMLIGAFKKIAVADVIGIIVNATFNNIADSNGLMVLISTILFAFQIYCDFSGYSDIARGCAKLFGVELTENFNQPYHSKSIKEFWNRWHISLSKWLRDYIYFPLGGSRVKKFRWSLNILIVFFVSGLWHGASFNFVIWGLLHAAFQIIGSFTLKPREKLWDKLPFKVELKNKLKIYIRTFNTFVLVCFAWIFFRCSDIKDAFLAITKLFTDWHITGEYFTTSMESLGLNWFMACYAILSVILMLTLELLKKINLSTCKIYRFSVVRYSTYLLLAWCVICSWMFLQASEVGSSFIYFQF